MDKNGKDRKRFTRKRLRTVVAYGTIKVDMRVTGKQHVEFVRQFGMKGEYVMKRLCYVLAVIVFVSGMQGCSFQQNTVKAEGVSSVELEREESENQEWAQMRESINAEVQEAYTKSEVEERERKVTTEGGKVITLEGSRWTYLAESGEEYSFNEKQQLIVYSDEEKIMQYANLEESEVGRDMFEITPDEAMQLFVDLYKEQIPQLEKYELVRYYEYSACYELFLERRISEYLADSILLNISGKGEILWFCVYYCGLEEITDTQRQQLEELLVDYIEHNQSSAIDYRTNVRYRKAGDMIVARYTVVYQYADGAEYAEDLDFAIEG